ncbi:hypothetical protein [Variovorax saccharolyticus]|uniref:hypothetical protein n=1 Tax=Variovorax saccharolyticus TaxID=3053516 RepID=UPI0025788A20|nr:hypothetical protein [Variovorax sp. J31P216]MDM0029679.1 hypothetical protein [Variovorax sp. J31P216]
MKPSVHGALRNLQELAYAQLLSELDRFQRDRLGKPAGFALLLNDRLARCQRQVARFQTSLSHTELSELRVARAVYLRMLLSSAFSRLRGWETQTCPASTPISHLHEWLAHDLERLELTELESGMSCDERDAYLRAVRLSDACD